MFFLSLQKTAQILWTFQVAGQIGLIRPTFYQLFIFQPKNGPTHFKIARISKRWISGKLAKKKQKIKILINTNFQEWYLTAADFYCEPQIIIFKIHCKLEISLHKPFSRKYEAFGEKIEIIDNHVDNATQIFTIMKVSNICWVFIQKDFEKCILLN